MRLVLEFLSSWVLGLKIKDYLFCILSAVLLILSFPNFNLWIFAGFGFVPLFFALKNKSQGKAFLLAYFTGVIFWLGIIYWLIHVTLLGMILLVLYLALYFGIFGLFIRNYGLSRMQLFREAMLRDPEETHKHLLHSGRITNYELLFIPAAWVFLEYIRSHLLTGFPWALLGYSQYSNIPLIQIADITGAWGVSFLVMLVNVAIYSVITRQLLITRRIKNCLIPILCLFITLAYGDYKLSAIRYPLSAIRYKISVIQGNIPQRLKWDVGAKEFIMDRHFSLSAQAAADKPDLIIWPEAAVPLVLEEESLYYKELTDFAKKIKMSLLLGAVTYRNNLYYNSALLFSDKGRRLSRYDKLHLVPFGEYIPLRRIFSFLETVVPIGDFMAGREYTIFKIPNSKGPPQKSGRPEKGLETQIPNNFSVLICFEDLFPELSREFVKEGAGFLVNITNDAWFGRTSSPYQHLAASVFRAVENRIYLVRAANTGVSGFIAPSGKILSLVKDQIGRNIFISGFRTEEITISRRDLSFYTRYGDFFIIGCFLLVLYGIISPFKKKR